MARSKTTRSKLRLSEVARHVVIPTGIVSTGWPAVEAKCVEWGDDFDTWQSGLGRVVLGKRADGLYAATVGGITISIPRQVAKTFIVGRIVFALCALFPGLRVLWTAHHTATLSNTFRSLAGYARRRKVAPYIAHVRRGSGKESIEFTNGSTIYFGAREQGFGRGFEEIDLEVFDEAQILTEKALEDMVAATNQARHVHGALLFYMGTPPRPIDPGEAFTSRRKKALAAKPADVVLAEHGDSVFVECSADPNIGKPGGPSLDDRDQWKIANPSYPHRTPEASMLRLRENLPSDDAWRREAMGVWDSAGAKPPVISVDVWKKLHIKTPPAEGRRTYGVKFSIDGSTVALGVALRPDDGPVHLEVIKHKSMASGTGWLVDWLVERWRDAAAIVVDGKAGAGPLVNALRERRVPAKVIVTPTADQVVSAHAMILEAVSRRGLTHFKQPALDASVAGAGKRDIGKAGGWGFAPLTPDDDVTPVESVTLALYGAMTSKRRPGRKARGVVMS